MPLIWTATYLSMGAQWLSDRVLDSGPKGHGFEPHRRHCVVSLSKNIYPSLVLVQPRKTRPYITERLRSDVKNQIKQNKTYLSKHVNIFSLEITLIRRLAERFRFSGFHSDVFFHAFLIE